MLSPRTMHNRQRLLSPKSRSGSSDSRNWFVTATVAVIVLIMYWRLSAAKQVTANVHTSRAVHPKILKASTAEVDDIDILKPHETLQSQDDGIRASSMKSFEGRTPDPDVLGEEPEDVVEVEDTPAVEHLKGIVPVVKHPEFVYGGKWAAKKQMAVTTSDMPTTACHATTVLHLEGGQVLMAWFGGTYEGAEDVGIWVSKRDSNGWEYPHVAAKVFRNAPYHGKNLKSNGPYNLAEPPRQGREPHWNPVLWCQGAGQGDGDGAGNGVCKGTITLYFKVGWKIPEWETYVTHSDDQGQSWSTPKELIANDKGGRGPVKNKPILSSDNLWLAPASLEGPKPSVGHRKRVWRSFVDVSDDFGQTWKMGAELMPEEAGWGSIQPTLWESRPGVVHMMTRSSRGGHAPIWRADSVDGGKTWSKMYRTDMPNNNSGLDVCKLPLSGTLIMAYNPTTEDRFPMQLAISENNGKSWDLGYNVETEGGAVKDGHEYSYPACVPWPANAHEEGFSVSYTWHRQHPIYISMSLRELKELAKPIKGGKMHF